jgi:hypothetical protein
LARCPTDRRTHELRGTSSQTRGSVAPALGGPLNPIDGASVCFPATDSLQRESVTGRDCEYARQRSGRLVGSAGSGTSYRVSPCGGRPNDSLMEASVSTPNGGHRPQPLHSRLAAGESCPWLSNQRAPCGISLDLQWPARPLDNRRSPTHDARLHLNNTRARKLNRAAARSGVRVLVAPSARRKLRPQARRPNAHRG